MRYLPAPVSPFYRWIVFNAVGAMGFTLQMSLLFLMVHFAGLHYLLSTALAVEAAILHNFFWHEKWTWVDRSRAHKTGWVKRLVCFHLANGIVSLTGNILLMRFFVGTLGMHYVPANGIALVLCAILNYFAGDRLVFRTYRASAFNGDSS